MGSGCNNNNVNKCLTPISSNCVLYQGDPNSSLGICTGDTITEVEQVLISTIEALKGATGSADNLTLESLIITCQDIATLIGDSTKTVDVVLSAVITYCCKLKDIINTSVGTGVIDTKCVNVSSSNFKDIIQATINTLCDLKDQVTAITTNIQELVDTSVSDFLSSSITSCNNYGITKSGSGESFTMNFYGFVPPFCPIAYYGPLANFDANGKGLVNSSYCGWYLCNGKNGTPDLRGRNIVGSLDMQGGNALDSVVDPNNPVNATSPVNYKIGDKFGENFHQLNITELPAHSHAINDPGHTHTYNTQNGNNGGSLSNGFATNHTSNFYPFTTGNSVTGITVNSTGGSLPHENRQPSIALAWIMRIN